jgi:hypothetical protein
MRPPPSKTEVNYDTPPGHNLHAQAQEWQQEVELPARPKLQMPPIPEPEQMTDRKQMIAYDAPLPEVIRLCIDEERFLKAQLVSVLPVFNFDTCISMSDVQGPGQAGLIISPENSLGWSVWLMLSL